MPRISVLLPVFNEEKHLKKAIDSVLSQNLQDFELLVLDDASTDKSLEIVSEYAKDSKVRVISHKKRAGFTKSLNILLKESKGDFVCIIGADDIYTPNMLEASVKFHEENPKIGATYSDYYWIDDNDNVTREISCMEYDLSMLMMSEYVNLMTMMIKRTCLEEIGGFDEELKLSQDSLMKLEIGHRYGMARIPEMLVKYRLREGSITTGNPEEQQKYLELAKKKFRANHPELKEIKVTIGVPTYNSDMKYLKECFESIKNQNCKNFEVIVMDDGSDNKDEVEKMAKEYGFRYFWQKNRGIGGARNAIIDRMSDDSDYLCFLSSDDLMHPDYIRVMCKTAEDHKQYVAYSDYLVINEKGNLLYEYKAPMFEQYDDFCISCLSLAEHDTMFVNFSTTFFPAKMIKRERFDDAFRYGEDLEFLLRTVLVKRQRYMHVQNSLVKVRLHIGSETSKRQDEIAENNAKILKKIGGLAEW